MIRRHAWIGACERPIAAARRLATIGLLSPVLCLLFSSGCTTTLKNAPPTAAAVAPAMALAPAPEPENPRSATVVATPPPAVVQVSPPTVPAGTLSPPAELMLFVESTPPGATIVMDGRPMGKAPLHLSIPATPLGFSATMWSCARGSSRPMKPRSRARLRRNSRRAKRCRRCCNSLRTEPSAPCDDSYADAYRPAAERLRRCCDLNADPCEYAVVLAVHVADLAGPRDIGGDSVAGEPLMVHAWFSECTSGVPWGTMVR